MIYNDNMSQNFITVVKPNCIMTELYNIKKNLDFHIKLS